MVQEEAELGVVMDNMSTVQELLRQKEDRLKVLENALLGGLVSCRCTAVSFQNYRLKKTCDTFSRPTSNFSSMSELAIPLN